MTRALVASVVAIALIGCSKQEPSGAAPSARPSASPAQAPVVSAPPATSTAAKAPSWFEGSWHGSYEAQRYKLEVPKSEGAREWKDDDGGAHSGEGKIVLQVSTAGGIAGSAAGPLGEQSVSGEVDGDVFRIRFTPRAPGDGFRGVTVLKREGKKLTGRLQSSSGDSLTVRDAVIELERGAAGESPAPARDE